MHPPSDDPRDDASLPTPRAGDVHEVLSLVAEAAREGHGAVLATVLTRRGSSPGTPGQKLGLTADGRCMGTVGGGSLERRVLRAMMELLGRCETEGAPEPAVLSLSLGASLGMCCGGGVEVLLEPFAAAARVGVVGAGHVAGALVPVLGGLGFGVTVVDDREAWAVPARFAGARVVLGSHAALGPWVPVRGAVLVMTHDHALDQEAIAWALRAGYALVGGVGSRAKIARTRRRLEAQGFAPEDIARVRMPLGLAVGARSPAEIAVAIAAELIAWRRGFALAPGARMALGPEPLPAGDP